MYTGCRVHTRHPFIKRSQYLPGAVVKKRFIAGAVCPKCAAMDRLVVFEDTSGSVRECVECGYTDRQSNLESSEELQTRVNQTEDALDADEGIIPLKNIH